MKLKNKELTGVYNAVRSIKVYTSKMNRKKFKLMNCIKAKIDELGEDQKRILEDYSVKDDDGKAIVKDGSYDIKDTEGVQKDINELADEVVTINFGEHADTVSEFMSYLENYEGELDGPTGEGIFILQEAYESEDK